MMKTFLAVAAIALTLGLPAYGQGVPTIDVMDAATAAEEEKFLRVKLEDRR